MQSALWLQIHNIFLLRLELHKRFKILKMFNASILLFFSSPGGFWTLVQGRFSLCLSRHSRLAILKEFCHAVYYLFKNWANNCLCINRIPKMMSSFVIQDLIQVLKLFPVICCYGLHGWTWIKPIFSRFNAMPTKITKNLLWLLLPHEMCLISSSLLSRSILCMGKCTK